MSGYADNRSFGELIGRIEDLERRLDSLDTCTVYAMQREIYNLRAQLRAVQQANRLISLAYGKAADAVFMSEATQNEKKCLTLQTDTTMEKKNPIEEARRYVANAKEAIKKAVFDENLKIYTDGKYVKTAGCTLWNGCLIALDAVLGVKAAMKKGKRPDIKDYKEAAAKRDKKLLAAILAGYEVMHLSMGYDGTLNKKVCDEGFTQANAIIDRCAILIK